MSMKTETLHRLLVVAGTSPAIITEAFYQLRVVEKKPVSEIHVITTVKGNEFLQRDLMGEDGAFAQLCAEYKIKRKDILFGPKTITVANDEAERMLRNIQNEDEHDYFSNQLINLVKRLTNDDDSVLYACLSGGRRTMSFYLGVAMMLFGRPQDELLHTLVDDKLQQLRNPTFFYPTTKVIEFSTAKVLLPRLAFLRFRDRFGMVNEGHSYKTLVNLFQQEVDQLPKSVEDAWPGLFPRSKNMQRILRECRNKKFPNRPALITGETGTGKKLLARYLHNIFRGEGKKLYALDLGATHKETLESTLFGHVKGAFTGADKDRKSAFEEAEDGTLFLDEIHRLGLEEQDKLLRVIQEGEYKRLGENKVREVTCQIVIATNEDLQKAVDHETFHEDLWYRINAFEYRLPPLREREVDIIPLAEFFLAKFNEESGMKYQGMSEEFKELLLFYGWKGNVRALENVLMRSMSRGDGHWLVEDDLPGKFRQSLDSRAPIDRAWIDKVEQILEDCNGNIKEAARYLGINVNTLRSRMEKFGIDANKYRPGV